MSNIRKRGVIAFIYLGLIVIAYLMPTPLTLAQQETKTFYKDREIAQTMHWRGAEWLIRENRENEERVSELLQSMQIKKGMTVCDLGAGNGYHALLMSEMVGSSGKILAIDIQPEMLELLNRRAKSAGIKNIETILGGIANPNIPPESCDLLLMVDVYHEISEPEKMLKHIHQSLNADGLVVLVEYREEDPQVPIKPLHKMSKQQILKEYLPNGFELEREYDNLPWQHVMFFGRKEK